jgi:hypothetical protein
MTGVFGQSASTLMRARLVVFSPKWVHEQMAMQISHSVQSERFNFSMSITSASDLRPPHGNIRKKGDHVND